MSDYLNVDPKPNERVWYSHTITGDRGYIVWRDGKETIRLDRPREEILRTFRRDEWAPDLQHRPLTRHQLARVAFEADRALCVALGEHDKAKKQWLDLSDEQRIRWMDVGPPAGPRRTLYDATMTALADLAK